MRFCGSRLHWSTGAFTGQPGVFLPSRTAATSDMESFFVRPGATRTSIGGSLGNALLSAVVESLVVSPRAAGFPVRAEVDAESPEARRDVESAVFAESRRSSP